MAVIQNKFRESILDSDALAKQRQLYAGVILKVKDTIKTQEIISLNFLEKLLSHPFKLVGYLLVILVLGLATLFYSLSANENIWVAKANQSVNHSGLNSDASPDSYVII